MTRKTLSEQQEQTIKKLYCDHGVSMKNIALYYSEINQPVEEGMICRYLRANNLKRNKEGPTNVQSLPGYESIYTKAHKILNSLQMSMA